MQPQPAAQLLLNKNLMLEDSFPSGKGKSLPTWTLTLCHLLPQWHHHHPDMRCSRLQLRLDH